MRWVIALGIVATASAASAQVRDDDRLEADRLFQEGRTLLDAGKRVDACAKFDLSFRKDPRAVGTMLNLGLCREEAGQVASAVRFYAEARDRARDQDLTEHREAAERKLALLAARVPHLQLRLPPGAAPDTRVIVDQVVLGSDELASFAVDPGTRSIVVTAKDKLPYETQVTIGEGELKTVDIPALRGARTVVLRPSPRRLWGKILVGSGASLGALGVGLGLYGRARYNDEFPADADTNPDAKDPNHHCFTYMGKRGCDAVGASHVSTARLIANSGTVTGAIGAAALLTGAYLWWTAPDAVSVDVEPTGASVAFRTRW